MPGKVSKTIVTGQQIGLLGGPLYTTFKVLGALKLADRLQGRAVYWLETNDADFNEINHCEFIDEKGQLSSLRWQKESQGYSCGLIDVDADLRKLLDTYFKKIKQTEFTPKLREVVLDCYQSGKPLGQASRLLAEYLFSGYPLEIFDPQNQDFRQASRPILMKEAERTLPGDQCQLFCIEGKKRVALFRCGDRFCDRQERVIDLANVVLVPNVKTRNLCQDHYFHTHTYVAGPGEITYISQLDPFYQYHRIKKSRIEERMSLTMIEPKVKRLLAKLKLDTAQLELQTRDRFVKTLFQSFTRFDARQVLADARMAGEEFISRVEQMGLEVRDLRKAVQSRLKEMVGKKRAWYREEQAERVAKAGVIHDHLFPFGQKQERVFNIFYFMNLYGGRDFIHRLYQTYDKKKKYLEI